MFNIAALLSLVSAFSLVTPPNSSSAPDAPFDEYGTISWEHEKARLDNFYIQLQNFENMIGYILVKDAVDGCPGEAQARAIRAKRYVVEHRGVAPNRVVWRVEGYREEVSTLLLLAPPEITLPHPFQSTIAGHAGPLTKPCKRKLARIKKIRW